jgi:RNA polymerase sigma-70 factor (ECF subfamily)
LERLDADDVRLVERLRSGDEAAFRELVREHNGALQRVAMIYVRRPDVAEEVVQETWLAVLNGLDRFEGRSSLKTWIFRILANIAKTRAERERRVIPVSTLEDPALVPEPAVPPGRFRPPYDPRRPGWWATPPERWELPEEQAIQDETVAVVRAAIDELPPNQRAVITLRDVLGWPSDEVRNALGLSATNQRVLLHRARSKVRQALEAYMAQL